MSGKIDPRIPKKIDTGIEPIKSPWDKIVSYREGAHYAQRYSNVVAAAVMQAFRILVPDYVERSKAMCTNAYNRLAYVYSMMPGYTENNAEDLHMHPFMRGNFVGGLIGDRGDDELLMCGRVNDFGTYRAEKELDVCYWDLVGSTSSGSASVPSAPRIRSSSRRKRTRSTNP